MNWPWKRRAKAVTGGWKQYAGSTNTAAVLAHKVVAFHPYFGQALQSILADTMSSQWFKDGQFSKDQSWDFLKEVVAVMLHFYYRLADRAGGAESRQFMRHLQDLVLDDVTTTVGEQRSEKLRKELERSVMERSNEYCSYPALGSDGSQKGVFGEFGRHCSVALGNNPSAELFLPIAASEILFATISEFELHELLTGEAKAKQ
jgi:hypothetical protein